MVDLIQRIPGTKDDVLLQVCSSYSTHLSSKP